MSSKTFPAPAGVFPLYIADAPKATTFPAPAGVFPADSLMLARVTKLPRASGGVSISNTNSGSIE